MIRLAARAVPSTLIPCTQDRDFMIYDWASRHEAACRIVRETHPDLLPPGPYPPR